MTPSGRTKIRGGTRESLAWFNWNVSLRGVFETIFGGTTMVFVAYALAIGVPKNLMGYYGAAVSFACIVQLLCLPFAGRVRQRKRYILSLGLLEPLLLIVAVLVTPMLPPSLRVMCLGLALFLAAVCLHLIRPFADDWLATTIPSGLRGRYLGRRLRVSNIAIIAATLAVGSAVEMLGRDNASGLGLLLIVGAVFGVAAVLSLIRVHPPAEATPTRFTLADLHGVLRHRPFVRLIVGTFIFMVPFYFACAYYQVFNLEILQMSPWLIACMGVGYLVGKVVLTPWFGRVCDRTGPRRLLWISGPVYAAFFLCFPFAQPERFWPVVLGWAFVAVADAIYGVAAPAALYGTIPAGATRPAYFAVYNLLSLGGFALGGILAVPLLRLLQQAHWHWGVVNLGGYHLFYALCGLSMLPCMLAIGLMPEHRPAHSSSSPTVPPAQPAPT